jgi:hypothetical protein
MPGNLARILLAGLPVWSIAPGVVLIADVKDIDFPKLEPEAIVWANPCDGKRLRVLFLCVELAAAEVGSIAQRLEMDYEIATVECAWNWGETPERKARWLQLLDKDYDVCVLGARMTFTGPGAIRYRLMQKATEGMGVVTLWYWHWPFPESIIGWRDADGRGQGAFPGVPFDLRLLENLERPKPDKDGGVPAEVRQPRIDHFGRFIPAGFVRVPRVSRETNPLTLMAAERGQTRMVRVNMDEAGYSARPATICGGTYTPDMYIYDEYWASLLCKAILWAAHREPDASVERVSLQGDALQGTETDPVRATVSLRGRKACECTLSWNVHDYLRQTARSGQRPVSIKEGDQTIDIEFPTLDAGDYLVDVWLKRDGKTVDWGSGYFHVLLGKWRIEGQGHGSAEVAIWQTVMEPVIRLAKETHDRGEPVEGMVTDRDVPTGSGFGVSPFRFKEVPRRAELRLSVEDGWRRVVAFQRLPAKEPSVSFSIPVDAAVGGIGFSLRAELVVSGRVYARANYDFPIRKPAPDFLYNFNLAEDSGCSHIHRLRRRVLLPWRSDGDNYVADPFTASVIAWDNLEPNSRPLYIGGSFGHREPYPPDALKQWSDVVARITRDLTPYGIRFINCGDDSGPSHSFGKEHAGRFQEHLRQKFGTLERLNQEWNVQVGAWEEVTQQFVDDQKSKKNYAPATESYRFGEDVFYGYYRTLRETAQAVRPDMAVGQFASGWGAGMGQFLEAGNYFAPYWRDYLCETVGAFYGKQKGYYGVNGGYPGNAFEPWYPLLSGCNYYSNWCSPARLGGDLALVEGNRLLNESAREIQQGIGMQVVRAERQHDPVAILYSRSSGWASSLDSTMAEIENSRENFNAIFHDLGLEYIYVYEKHLQEGVLRKDGIRLLALPYCQAIGREDADALRSFVQSGGTLLADVRPAIWNDRCQALQEGLLDDVFGIRRERLEEYVVFGDLKVTKPVPGLAAGEILGSTTANRSVRCDKAEPWAEVAGVPAVLVHPFGQGKAVLLNTFVGRYRLLQADGESLKLNRLYRWIAQQAGLETDRVRAACGGRPAIALRRARFQNGPMEILGVCKRGLLCEKYPVSVTLDIPQQRHIYDIRGGRYLGLATRFMDSFQPEHAKFYALLPYKLKKLWVKLPRKAERGVVLVGTVSLQVSHGEAAPHVEFLRVKGPDGAYCDWFERKLMIERGTGELRLPIARNERPGRYTVEVKDVPTGTVSRAAFEVR